MVLQMPRPTKSHKTGIYYFRARYPADVRQKVGKGEFKVSLRTKDPEEAKRLFLEKEREFNSKCQALRSPPTILPHRQMVGLAGRLYSQVMSTLEKEPGEPEIWMRVLEIDEQIGDDADKAERWYGASVDELLLSEGISLDPSVRPRLLQECRSAFKQVAEQQLKRSKGDYRPDPNAGRFPDFNPTQSDGVTLDDLFKAWERDHKADGRSPRTVSDFRQKIDDFIAFIGLPLQKWRASVR